MKNITRVQLVHAHIVHCQQLASSLSINAIGFVLAKRGTPSTEAEIAQFQSDVADFIDGKVQAEWDKLRAETGLPKCDIPEKCKAARY